MVTSPSLGERLLRWAQADDGIPLVVQIGSRVRPAGGPGAADRHSDWDFQVATAQPERFLTSAWLQAWAGEPDAYVFRPGRLGSAAKVSAVIGGEALDLVVIPLGQLQGIQQAVAAGRHREMPPVWQALVDQAAVLQGGFAVRKGAEAFGPFLDLIVATVPPPRLDDAQVRAVAEGFVCDYVSTCAKLERGELVAARRWLHHHLAEANLRLLHELRQREGRLSFPDGRRLEQLEEARIAAVAASAGPDAASLRAAARGLRAGCEELMAALVGGAWRWPAQVE